MTITNMESLVNTSVSLLGKDIIEWIHSDKSSKSEKEQIISSKLYHKYIVDREGKPKAKIFPNVYYYVNYNNYTNPEVYQAYIVRDKVKSPRKIPDNLIQLNIFEGNNSFKGTLISEWAYYQNGSSENPYYMEGCDIVTQYLESEHPIRKNIYYFVSKNQKGQIKIFRDLDKSPRTEKPEE